MIPFVGPSHPLPLDRVDLQRSINLYPVAAEDGGEKSESHLAPAPGLRVWSDAPAELGAYLSINNASGNADDGAPYALVVTRSGDTTGVSTVHWSATGDTFDGSQGFERSGYTGVLTFAAGETTKTIEFVLQVTDGEEFDAVVILSDPSSGTFIVDGTGTMAADGASPPFDEHWDDVLFLHPFDDIANPDQAIDVQGKTWTWVEPGGSDMSVSAPDAKYGAGGLFAKNTSGGVPKITATYSDVPLDAGGLNRFTVDGWINRSNFGISAVGVILNGGQFLRIETQGGLYLRGTFSTGLFELFATMAKDDFRWCEANYDGTHLRLFVDGVMGAKHAIAPGTARTIIGARIGQESTSSGDQSRIDDARFTCGVCRHPSDDSYTPPTMALPTEGPS